MANKKAATAFGQTQSDRSPRTTARRFSFFDKGQKTFSKESASISKIRRRAEKVIIWPAKVMSKNNTITVIVVVLIAAIVWRWTLLFGGVIHH